MAEALHPLAGRASHAIIFRCATCNEWQVVEGLGGRIAGDQAERRAIRAGWVRGRGGWRCPKCMQAILAAARQIRVPAPSGRDGPEAPHG